MKLAIVCYPTLGGSGVVAAELAIGLAERGHAVHLVASALPQRAVRSRRVQFHEVSTPSYPLFEHAPYTLAVAGKIAELAAHEKLDLVHVHYAVPHAASAFLARQMLAAGKAPRFVTSLHGTDVTGVGADPRLRAVIAFAVRASDGIITPSRHLRGEAQRRLGLPAADIEVIPNFVDTERFSPADKRDRSRFDALFPRAAGHGPVLFHVSNFRPVKRVGDLLEVLARVRREVPARLVAVGDGPDRATAEARAAALGLEDAVRFSGRRADFVDDLRHADGFVLPSETESFGVAALEALSAGVPVFAYRVGGLPEVVADGAGHLVEPFDVDALAAAVLDGTSAAKHQALARGARAHAVAHFGREPAIAQYEAYFRRILEHP